MKSSVFFDVRVECDSEQFAHSYDLLEATFDESKLSPRSFFLSDFQLKLPDGISPFVMLSRFKHESAEQSCPIVSVVSGYYLMIDPIARLSVGFIEYLTTHPSFRYTQGHGTAMLAQFEAQMRQIAAQRYDHLLLIAGEVPNTMLNFKIHRGYRWPQGSIYFQPPIAYDFFTGEPQSDPVPFMLMIKTEGDPVASSIDTALLIQTVDAIYRERYGAPSGPSSAKVEALKDALLQQFVASVSAHGKEVPLVIPSA